VCLSTLQTHGSLKELWWIVHRFTLSANAANSWGRHRGVLFAMCGDPSEVCRILQALTGRIKWWTKTQKDRPFGNNKARTIFLLLTTLFDGPNLIGPCQTWQLSISVEHGRWTTFTSSEIGSFWWKCFRCFWLTGCAVWKFVSDEPQLTMLLIKTTLPSPF